MVRMFCKTGFLFHKVPVSSKTYDKVGRIVCELVETTPKYGEQLESVELEELVVVRPHMWKSFSNLSKHV